MMVGKTLDDNGCDRRSRTRHMEGVGEMKLFEPDGKGRMVAVTYVLTSNL